ncbi:hypothetical protein NCER_101047 [Vairimorpha ceranae BRL01]|uniref:Uncharacterized protein n=2 Tax=Vairimorpha ceranae TaxID=40302 RepID=C4V938_VAIC1|nr:hypothetical protein AAJ76_1040004472 [Vairimorpha ceranae]EEQ82261.1 hypothetical protein NCER_101047 [Vairimorpha ceranae BRL01]KAF5140419.1 hypothetical protein G9O61_00g014350 [Vairimorpha ceranae]KKO74186.1 hypothetical protein AAJ76_1040004472 [Vairimorpha ceranae]
MFIIFLLKNYGCILKENNEMAIVEVHHSNGSLDNSNDVNTKPSTSKESCGITIDKQANSNNVGTVEEDNKNKRENITGELDLDLCDSYSTEESPVSVVKSIFIFILVLCCVLVPVSLVVAFTKPASV